MAQPRKNNFRFLNAGLFFVFLLCGLALYFIPLQSTSFYFDDHSSVEYNQAIRTLDIPRIFNTFNTRFLAGLSFALNYQLCALHPAGYRLINLLIHCLNAFLVYLLVKVTLGLFRHHERSEGSKSVLRSFGLRPQDDTWPAIFASMLFLCHPIQTEPVNFITQRFVLMGTFFYLLTLYLYIQYRCRSKKQYLTAGIMTAIAAMFCKEFVITLPIMLALYEFYFLRSNETVGKRCRHLVPFFIIVLIVPLMLLRTPPEATGVAAIADSDFVQVNRTQKIVTNVDISRAYGGVGRKQYFLTELNVVCTYIRLLFVPVNQDFDYDYPLAHGINAKTMLCGLFLLCLLAIAWITYQSYRIVSFGILWFFIALSVESSIIPIGHVIAEYRVYLASVGFVFLVTHLIYRGKTDPKRSNMIAAAILIVCSILTFQRNNIWKDEITLWTDSVQKSPHKARPFYSRGFAYFDQGKFNQAMPDMNEAIAIKPDYIEVYINRGIINYEQGNLSGALSDFNKAIKINPRVADVYYNRGLAYSKQGNIPQAISDFNKTIEINPDYVKAYINLGSISMMQGDLTQALSDYNKAIRIYPPVGSSSYLNIWINGHKTGSGYVSRNNYESYADVYYDRGCVYDQEGNLSAALSDYNTAIVLNPDYADAYNNRGYIYSRQKNFTQAVSDFNKAIAINPNVAGYYYNRGLNFNKQGNLSQAVSDFTQAVKINTNYEEAYYNRGLIFASEGDFAQALSDYNKVLEINPNNTSAYANRGTFYAQQGKINQAFSDFNKAIELNPSFSQTYVNRAVLYFQLKQFSKSWNDVYVAEKMGAVVNPAFFSALQQAMKQGR